MSFGVYTELLQAGKDGRGLFLAIAGPCVGAPNLGVYDKKGILNRLSNS